MKANDTIYRQAAISEIMEDLEDRSLHDDPATPEDYAEGYDEGIRNAAAIVLQMPSAQPDIPNINVIIDTIKNAIIASTGNDAYMVGLRNGMKWCWSALTDKEPEYEDIPFALPPAQPGWIPCSERCPEQSGWYLVSLKNGNVQKAWYRVAPINQGGSYWRSPIKRPLAWMPLPTPYREGEPNE